uniref:carbohydrate ABC transporter permease n=1 Tax=Aminobacter niigataensis TaxID=83265 RepID=UPI0028525801|nr:carbohydrate ABC transporter permease [Aminobacter niigataensis]WMD00097.1 carbohydrate ABC transporter permease [Aminobacter niigataensis]
MTEQGFSQRAFLAVLLLGALVFTVGPIVYLVLSSFKPEVEILSQKPTLLPATWYFSNYRMLFEVTPIISATKNSVIIACLVTLMTVVCASYTAYLLTRTKMRGLDFASKILLFCYALPDVIVGIGFYMIFAQISALNNYLSVALGQCAITVPFGIWMLWAYFRQIPVELDEAALIDGANRFQIIWMVIRPIAMPGIAAVAVYSFIISWNEYTLANMLITRDDLKTLPIVMGQLVKAEGAFWGLAFAMATVSLIPALLFVFFMLKPLISGLTVGALKG